MMKSLPIFTFILLLTFSCQESPKSETKEKDVLVKANTNLKEPTKLRVNIDNLRLRKNAGAEADVLTQLKEGTILYELGETSHFTTKIKLRGIQFDEPWIKVKTANDTIGWVYAGAVSFDYSNPNEFTTKLLERRLYSFFGKEIGDKFKKYDTNYQAIKTSKDFKLTYVEGLNLRDSFNQILINRIEIDDYQNVPDLFWIEKTMPAYIPHLVAEGTTYYFFKNYKDLQKKAATTEGKEDDGFIDLCLKIYEQDSIESFFPSWMIQTWDYGGNSELGKGIHFEILKKMSALLDESTLFEDEIQKFKTNLINDITDPNVLYWESKKNILKELDKIIKTNFSVLSNDDKVALNRRRKMFENPKKNNIKLDQRSGN